MVVLNGAFSYFNLSSILRFLYANKITGTLILTREKESIQLYFLKGKLVGVESSRRKRDPLENLVDAAVWLNGEFSLEILPEEKVVKNISTPSDQVILLLAKKENTFKSLKESLPPLDSILVMNPESKNEEIRLQPDEWNILSKVDGKRTMEEIIHMLNLDDLSLFSMVVKMIQKGILNVAGGKGPEEGEEMEEKAQPSSFASEKVPESKIKELEKIFMRYVGPMGTIILDEILESLELNRAKIPYDMLPVFIEKMSKEIDAEEDRRHFIKETQNL